MEIISKIKNSFESYNFWFSEHYTGLFFNNKHYFLFLNSSFIDKNYI